jgi:hypothetical protein
VRIPIKATAREPITQAGYISATSAIRAHAHLRSAAGPYMRVTIGRSSGLRRRPLSGDDHTAASYAALPRCADFVEKVGSRILAGNQPEQVCARGARMAFMRQIDSVAGLSWNQIPAATLLRVDQSRCSDFFNEIGARQPQGNRIAMSPFRRKEDVSSSRCVEWDPWGGHDQAASLTGGQVCCFSYCSGLR